MSEIREVMELIDSYHYQTAIGRGTEAREELRCAIIDYGRARWQPIEKGLPKKDGLEVLVKSKQGWGSQEVYFATWNEKDQQFDSEGGWFEIDEVTHWMRIHD